MLIDGPFSIGFPLPDWSARRRVLHMRIFYMYLKLGIIKQLERLGVQNYWDFASRVQYSTQAPNE
jgi:hypothetical protein